MVKQDLVGLSDAEAEALVQEKLAEVQGGVSKLGLISGKGEEEEENLLRTGLAAMKGRRRDAVRTFSKPQVLAAARSLHFIMKLHADLCLRPLRTIYRKHMR